MVLDSHELRERIEREGFAIVPEVVSEKRVLALAATLEEAEALSRIRTRAGLTYGSRNALDVPEVRELAASPEVRALVEPVLGPGALAVRGLVFDKVAGANWQVPWHQDLAIAVRERRDVPGFQGWSVKAGVPHVQPPSSVLEAMLAVRVHLDDVDEESGPLRVLPGTHRKGKLERAEIGRAVETTEPTSCKVSRGGVVLMRPLLLHASSRARRPGRRRVVHLEYASHLLPAGLAWSVPVDEAEHERRQRGTFSSFQRTWWPFPATPTTPTHVAQIEFLEAAFSLGFTPFFFGGENFEATNDALRRSAWLIYRGFRRKWEVGLGERGEHLRGFILEGFDRCGRAALRWLRGESADEIVATSGPVWRHTWPARQR